jgi:hypothetical protein
MIKARCYRCGNPFTLTEQFVSNALAAQGVTAKPTHYATECPRCRHVNKLSLGRAHLPEPEPPAPAGSAEP